MKPIFSNFFLTFFASSLLFLSGLQIVVVYGEDVELCSGESSFGFVSVLFFVFLRLSFLLPPTCFPTHPSIYTSPIPIPLSSYYY
jgi:hypothetical protein